MREMRGVLLDVVCASSHKRVFRRVGCHGPHTFLVVRQSGERVWPDCSDVPQLDCLVVGSCDHLRTFTGSLLYPHICGASEGRCAEAAAMSLYRYKTLSQLGSLGASRNCKDMGENVNIYIYIE
jgi:hypothetical protein